MRVLVCGGREYEDFERVCGVMAQAVFDYDITSVMHGACCDKDGNLTGADGLAERWAILHEFPYFGVPARWTAHGRAAGPVRNKQMLDEGKPDLVVAFPGGNGTANMVKQARAMGVEVIEAGPYAKGAG